MSFLKIYRKSIELLESKAPFVLATLIRSLGSTPQKTGASAIFEPNGKVHGTLGGGCLEAEARKRSLEALDHGRAFHFHVKLDDISGWDDGLICGGQATILVQPNPAGHLEALKQLSDAAMQGRSGILVTSREKAPAHLWQTRWLDQGTAPDARGLIDPSAWDETLRNERAILLGDPSHPDAPLQFLEPSCPPPELLVAGAGHIGKAVCALAAGMGFKVAVVDDRPDFASADRIPEADQVCCGPIPQTVADWPVKESTYIVIVTRGHQHDGATLAACVRSPAAFIGMIGSRRKSLLIRQHLVDQGKASPEEIRRVVCPIGLDIGSVSVPEIALSIVSQLVAHRRLGSLQAGSMTYSKP